MTTKISIVSVKDHKNIQEAIIKGIELIEDSFKFKLQELSNILLKPNPIDFSDKSKTSAKHE